MRAFEPCAIAARAVLGACSVAASIVRLRCLSSGETLPSPGTSTIENADLT